MAKKKRKKKAKKAKWKASPFSPKAGIAAALDRRAIVKRIQGELTELE